MTISFYQARQQILDTVPLLPVITVPLLAAAGRACATDIIAEYHLPAVNNSAMDGYAVRIEDCPIGTTLPVSGYLPAGEACTASIASATAVRIMTGAPIPLGANAVIPFETCAEGEGQITILHRVKHGDNIRWSGEDVRTGDKVVAAGRVLRPAEISLLAALRMENISVRKRVQVAILATGDELYELGQRSDTGIVNCNSPALAAAVSEIGADAEMIGIAIDDINDLHQKIILGLKYDVLITSAGVSAGDRDLVREVLSEIGAKELFWRLKIKPGQPTAFAMYNNVPIFSLPGNPVATLLTFEEFVRPALLKMMGHSSVLKAMYRATLIAPIKKKIGKLQILRVALNFNHAGELMASSAGDQNTGILTTLVGAQGVALLAAERDFFAAGEKIEVHLFGAATQIGY